MVCGNATVSTDTSSPQMGRRLPVTSKPQGQLCRTLSPKPSVQTRKIEARGAVMRHYG